jgi:hypothetical protein
MSAHVLSRVCAVILLAGLGASRARADQVIFDEALQNAWQNWSWATVNTANTSPAHGGGKSISITMGAWQALYLAHSAVDGRSYTNLAFWAHGGATGRQRVRVQAIGTGGAAIGTGITLAALPANAWAKFSLSLTALGVTPGLSVTGFWWQDVTGGAQPTFYLDDIVLIANNTPPQPATIRVDAAANRRAIDPRIYGVAFASTAELADLNCPLNRSGGNATTRYNWQLNAANHASDWFFESLPKASAAVDEFSATFFQTSRAGGAEPMLTVPMIDYVATLGTNRAKLASFSVAKYGPQQATDTWFPDAGNGVKADGSFVTGNDPLDAHVPNSVAFQQDWVSFFIAGHGPAARGGLKYYLLDNEPALWHSTHRDVHPTGATMDEILSKSVAYAAMIKRLDPDALIAGPEEWGWPAYFYSGFDQQYGAAHGWNPATYPDRQAHGGQDFVPWYLAQMQQAGVAAGRRLLDIVSLHIYPQGGEFTDDTSEAMQLLRNRSTRSLWDPAYVDASWINDKVNLIPRMKGWVTTNYPGTQIAVTEYNWGAEGHMNGATAQADILGIFGREGLDLAARWTTPAATTPTYKAIKLYRNYDGNKSTFGDLSVSNAVNLNADDLAAFSAIRSGDGALTVMVVAKALNNATTTTVSLANFIPQATAQLWQLVSNNITGPTSVSVVSNSIARVLPAQSIALFVIPAGRLAPTVALTAAPNPATAGSAVTLTAKVTPPAGCTNAPTGTILFKANGASLGLISLTGDTASLNTSALAAGTHNLTAAYSGDGTYGAVTSPAVSLTVNPLVKPDFVVTAITLTPASPTSGVAFAAAVTVKNQGQAAGDAKQLTLWADCPAVPADGTGGNASVAVGTLAAGASKTLTITGLIASPAGSKTLRAFVDSGNATAESNEGNNQLTKNYTVLAPPQPDFNVYSITLTPASPVAGAAFTASVVVRNIGKAAGDGGQLTLWTDQPAVPTNATGGSASVAVGTLAVGATKTLTLAGLTCASAGVKTLRAFVDSGNSAAESNETNNQLTKTYTVVPPPQPDFVITSMKFSPSTVTTGTVLTVTVVVKNQGTAAGDGKQLTLWADCPPAPANGAGGNLNLAVGTLAAGANKAITFTGLTAGALGNRVLRSFVDSANATVESNETNNQFTLPYTVAPKR